MNFFNRSVKPLIVATCATIFGGCVTISGNYAVTATDAQGSPINATFHVHGRHIYSARNAICASHPGATVTIKSIESGKELESESPYPCRKQRE